MYLKVNEVDRAQEKLQEATAIEPGHTNSLLALGAILQTKNESEAALNIYRKIPNLQNETFELWNNIGMSFYRKNKLIAVILPPMALTSLAAKFIFSLSFSHLHRRQFRV